MSNLQVRISDLATRVATECKSIRTLLNGNAADLSSLSTTVEGDKMIVIPYKDGATTIPFLYTQVHSRGELLRMMMIG